MATLAVPSRIHAQLIDHLLDSKVEQVAFLLAAQEGNAGRLCLRVRDLVCMPEKDLDRQSAAHVSLAEDVRPQLIKWAFDSGACLVEAHSHLSDHPAMFSSTDLAGLREFVPHVWWRLRGRPYMALVFSRTGFDALAWISARDKPEPVAFLQVGAVEQRPTGLTFAFLSRQVRQ